MEKSMFACYCLIIQENTVHVYTCIIIHVCFEIGSPTEDDAAGSSVGVVGNIVMHTACMQFSFVTTQFYQPCMNVSVKAARQF